MATATRVGPVWSWKPGNLQISYIDTRVQHLGPSSAASSGIQQRGQLEVEQLTLELVLIWDAGATGRRPELWYSVSPTYTFFQKDLLCLFQRDKIGQWEWQRGPASAVLFHMATTASAGPGWNQESGTRKQEPGASFISPMRVQRFKYLRHSLLPCQAVSR